MKARITIHNRHGEQKQDKTTYEIVYLGKVKFSTLGQKEAAQLQFAIIHDGRQWDYVCYIT